MSEVVDDLKNELAQIKEDVEIATQGEEGEEEFNGSEETCKWDRERA